MYLSKFSEIHPDINTSTITDDIKKLDDLFREHKIDILINYIGKTTSKMKDEIKTEILGGFKTCFACSKEFYKEEGYKIKKLRDLTNYDLVLSGKSRRRLDLEKDLKKYGVELAEKHSMHDSIGMVSFISQTKFIGYFIEDQIKNSDLVKINIEEELSENCIVILYNKYASQIEKDFVNIALNTKY